MDFERYNDFSGNMFMRIFKKFVCHFSLMSVFLIAGAFSPAAFAQSKAGAGQQHASPLSIKNRSEFETVKRQAESGDAQSQYRLSIAYSEGKFVKADDSIMVVWLKKAAEQNHTEAQFYLSAMYAKGIGVKQDYTQAVNWMRKVADKGVEMAQFNMGNMYETGMGVPKDQKQAIAWYRKAAAQGNPYAKKRLEELKAASGKQDSSVRK
jgi:TPR repeat protein